MSVPQSVQAPGADFVEKTAEADGFTITYHEAGHGDALVHVHGAGGPSMSFALDRLAREFRVIAVELPGFGKSEVNERTQSPAEMASTLAAFIKALELAPVFLFGTSMGGVVATHCAVDHPDAVKALILEGPGPFRSGATPPSARTPEELAVAFNNHPERVSYRQPAAPEPERWGLVMKIMGDEHDASLEARLHEIEVPTLAFWGIDDGIIPPVSGRIYKSNVPHCAYVLVNDAAHDVQGDRPEAVAELVGDFLKQGMNFVVNGRDGRINP